MDMDTLGNQQDGNYRESNGTGRTETRARDLASDATGTYNSSTGIGDQGVAEQAQQKAGEVISQVQDTAGNVASQVREQAATQLNNQLERAGSGIQTVAQAIRQTGQQLRDQEQAPIAEYMDRAAEQLERFNGYLGRRNVSEIITDVEQLARREPALFLGAAFGLGLLGARFLKSSGRQAQAQQYSGNENGSQRNWQGSQGTTGANYGTSGYGAGSGAAWGTGDTYGTRSGSDTNGVNGGDSLYGSNVTATGTDYPAYGAGSLDVTGTARGYTTQRYGAGGAEDGTNGVTDIGRSSDATDSE